jgi:hypothetical protein
MLINLLRVWEHLWRLFKWNPFTVILTSPFSRRWITWLCAWTPWKSALDINAESSQLAQAVAFLRHLLLLSEESPNGFHLNSRYIFYIWPIQCRVRVSRWTTSFLADPRFNFQPVHRSSSLRTAWFHSFHVTLNKTWRISRYAPKCVSINPNVPCGRRLEHVTLRVVEGNEKGTRYLGV